MDPRTGTQEIRAKSANYSALMEAKTRAMTGQKVNACPFGCHLSQLDDHGYCDHLIGFSVDMKTYEPMVVGPTGRREMRIARDRLDHPILERIPDGAHLERITSSYRVYHRIPPVYQEPEPIPAKGKKLEY